MMDFLIEAIGIFASVLVSTSLCLKNIKGLRIINLIGSFVFLGYGLLIRSPSILLLNGFAISVNIYRLLQMRHEAARPDLFDVVFYDSSNSMNDTTLRRFIRFYSSDISRFFPSFNPDPETGTLANAECCFILRETLPVSLVAYKREANNQIAILVDYVVPAYRDYKNSRFFFSNVTGRIASAGAVCFARGEVKAHIRYLKRMGFVESGREGETVLFRKTVT